MAWDPPGSSVHGILQSRTLEWIVISSSGDLLDLGIEPVSPASAGGFCYHWATSPLKPNLHLTSPSLFLSFPLWFITRYWIEFPVLYSRTLLFIHPIYNSLHLLIQLPIHFLSHIPPTWQPQICSLCLLSTNQSSCLGQQSELPWTETSGTQKGSFPHNPPLNVVRPSSQPSAHTALPQWCTWGKALREMLFRGFPWRAEHTPMSHSSADGSPFKKQLKYSRCSVTPRGRYCLSSLILQIKKDGDLTTRPWTVYHSGSTPICQTPC